MIPVWLYKKLREYKINWKHAPSSSMPEFFKNYTLHDAAWKGAITSPFRRDLIIVFSWDTWYADHHLPELANLAHFPYLVIRFPHVYAIYFPNNDNAANYRFLISSAWSQQISEEKSGLFSGHEELIAEDAFHTVIKGFSNETMHILHSKEIQVRCFNRNGTEILIPNWKEN